MKAAGSVNAMVPMISLPQKVWSEIIEPCLRERNLAAVKLVLLAAPGTVADGNDTGGAAGGSVKKKSRSVGRYLLRQGKGLWQLVFNGMETVIKHCRGIALVAQLLFHPPEAGIHGTELAALALGQSVVQEASLAADGEAGKKSIEQEAHKCMAVIHDPSASEMEKDEARQELAKLAKILKVVSHAPASGAEKQVRAVRRAIERLIGELRTAHDRSKGAQQALRAFGEHLHQYLWIPSSRYGGSRRARVSSGMAGRFVYERPAGVRWSE
jgi:hypothetical protein